MAESQGFDVTNEAGDGRPVGVARAPVQGFPAVVELFDLHIGHAVVGEQHKVRPGRIPEEVAVRSETFQPHVDRHPGWG
jgi:hypothetical protein